VDHLVDEWYVAVRTMVAVDFDKATGFRQGPKGTLVPLRASGLFGVGNALLTTEGIGLSLAGLVSFFHLTAEGFELSLLIGDDSLQFGDASMELLAAGAFRRGFGFVAHGATK